MKHRDYKKSSSFKAATLFAILITISVIALVFAIYLLSKEHNAQEVSNYVIILGMVSVLALVLIAIFGYLISIFVVTRINRITETAHEIITTGDLTKRLEIDSRWDDLSFLATVLNEMLEKIEILMKGVQHITETVAHDLRTPLARLRNKLEHVSLESTPHEQNLNEIISPLVHEVDRLLKTFNALLSLSSLESGRQGLKFESFNLEKVVIDAINLYAPLAEEKNQSISINTSPVNYLGDRDLIFQVVANLLDNAIKFTQQNGKITVYLGNENNLFTIVIADNGPGIPITSVEKVFERFYRDQSQHNQVGSGLGLSIVLAVLKLHHAEIKLEDNQPGLKVLIHFTNTTYE